MRCLLLRYEILRNVLKSGGNSKDANISHTLRQLAVIMIL